jgi:RecA/RadA recombinase
MKRGRNESIEADDVTQEQKEFEKSELDSLAEQIQDRVDDPPENDIFDKLPPPDFDHTVSTGSLVLDLNISGKVLPYGGIPSGVVVEVYGPSGSGKTSVLSEICGSAESRGGSNEIKDPEARLSVEYSRIYGVELNPMNYSRPDTVTDVFDEIFNKPKSEDKKLHVIGVDSLAALSTKLEMEKGDKMGQKRAKEFSEGLRKTARKIANNGWILVATNQVRQGDGGYEVTPGGKAFLFYSSLRMRVSKISGEDGEITRKRDINGKKRDKIIGIKSNVFISKSSLDEPYRKCEIFIVFGYGIHDIMTNLQFLKDMRNLSMYPAVDKDYQNMEQAVFHIEKYNLEQALRDMVVETWRDVERKFYIERKPKIRF